MKKTLLATLAAVATLSGITAVPAHAALTFAFEYAPLDPGNPAQSLATPAQKTAIETAGMRYSQMFASHFTNSGMVTLNVTLFSDPMFPELMSAGSSSGSTEGFGTDETARRAALGIPSGFPSPDGTLNINFGYSWELNPNAVPNPANTFDFYAAFTHELTHAIGFSSGVSPLVPNYTRTDWTKFDQFLVDSMGRKLINPTTFLLNQTVFLEAQNNGVFFDGPNARASNGGAPVEIDGSFSHIDFTVHPADPMRPGRGFGPDSRDLSAINIGIMTDIGFTPVPEPCTGVLGMIGVIGMLARRTRKQRA